MKLTLEPTPTIQSIDGTPCRLWTGTTETGIPVHAYIRCVSPQTHDAEAKAQFGRELRELPVPRRSGMSFDIRFIL